MSIREQYAVECDRCHVIVGWSVTGRAALAERHLAGWTRRHIAGSPRIIDLCRECSQATQ